MPLFKLQNDAWDHTTFYARDPAHIRDVVRHYREQLLSPEQRAMTATKLRSADPTIYSWIAEEPSLEGIATVPSGELFYSAGMCFIRAKGEEFYLHLRVLDDFTVHVNPESLFYFDISRHRLQENKVAHLRRLYAPCAGFESQNFLPEDVAQAILRFDLDPYYEFSREFLEGIAKFEDPHLAPGMKMTGSARNSTVS